MQSMSSTAASEIGTRRLIAHLATLDRLTREPALPRTRSLEQLLGPTTSKLALAAAGYAMPLAA
jgi:hypothetical protein